MRRRRALLFCLALLGPLAAGTLLLRQEGRPNIVLIVIDTLRRDHLPFYGYPKPTAPFLSELAARGVVFENAYAASSWTAPATATLFTSLYPFQHGVVTGLRVVQRLQERGQPIELNRIPARIETLGEAMKRAGYATYAVTQNPNISSQIGFDQGFDHFTNFPDEKAAESVTRKLRELRRGLRAEKRWFLYLHYMDPHGPYLGRRPLFDTSLQGMEREVSAYDSEIHYLDGHIRRAYQMLGWDRDTLLVVTADHGEEFGDHGGSGHGNTLFAEVLNVPLLMVFPGSRHGGRRVSERVSHVDLLPTLRTLAGLPRSEADAGVSLLPLVAGGRLQRSEPLLGHLYRDPTQEGGERLFRAAIDERWKWVGGMPGGPSLFDLRSDGSDRHNLAAQHPAAARALEAAALAYESRSRKYAGERVKLRLDEESAERLRALGYVN
jgi:arylsulfatase A-like enzyme